MRTQHITPEETKAMIALWNRQQSIKENGPRIEDVAEALGIAPQQAHDLLQQVRDGHRQQDWLNRARHAWKKHPFVRTNHQSPALSPLLSAGAMIVYGLAVLMWTAWSEQEWISFPISMLEKVALILSNAGLWTLFARWVGSIYQDVRRRRQ